MKLKKIMLTTAIASSLLMVTGCMEDKSVSKADTLVDKVQKTEKEASDLALKNQSVPSTYSNVSYEEGVHYRVAEDIDIEGVDSPVLVEYFWFGCPHCQAFEPQIKRFLKSNPNVSLVRKHAALNKMWGKDAVTFFRLQELGLIDEHFDNIFDIYREFGKKGKIPQKDDISKYLDENGVDSKAFWLDSSSDFVISKIEKSLNEMINNKIMGVPNIVVNGKYIVMLGEDIKTQDDYFKLLEYLLKK